MKWSKKYLALQWTLLIFIGTSVAFSTFHSHHPVEWTKVDHHVDTGNTLTQNTNLCPICGYMFGANVVGHQLQPSIQAISAEVVTAPTSQCLDSYTAPLTGRSPPLA